MAVDREGRGRMIACPTEQVADMVMEHFNGMLAVKYPTRRLRDA